MRKALIAILLLAAPMAAFAHTGHSGHGFGAGFMHPLSGVDHLLAMLAVGLWAAQAGGRARWVLPATFLAVMTLGGVLGAGGVAIPMVELGIAGSVAVFGLLIAFGARLPLGPAMSLTAALALCHGYAHGVEMASDASLLVYGAGFVAATAMLHVAGLLAGRLGASRGGALALRVAGGATAAVGALLLAGLA